MATKILHLLRHAKSAHDDYVSKDIERHLSAKGYRDAEEKASLFKGRHKTPQLIISSPAIRAFTSAMIFARKLDYEIENIAIEKNIYEASLKQLFHVINHLQKEFESLMIAGHNPGLTYFVNSLCGKNVIDELSTSAVATITFDNHAWSEINSASGELMDVI